MKKKRKINHSSLPTVYTWCVHGSGAGAQYMLVLVCVSILIKAHSVAGRWAYKCVLPVLVDISIPFEIWSSSLPCP